MEIYRILFDQIEWHSPQSGVRFKVRSTLIRREPSRRSFASFWWRTLSDEEGQSGSPGIRFPEALNSPP